MSTDIDILLYTSIILYVNKFDRPALICVDLCLSLLTGFSLGLIIRVVSNECLRSRTDREIYSRLYAMSSHITYSYGEYTQLSAFRDKNNNPDAVSILEARRWPRAHQPHPLPPLTLRTRSRPAVGSCSRKPCISACSPIIASLGCGGWNVCT